MIRPEVEKLRGLVLTPEELNDVILPLVATAKERNNKQYIASLEERIAALEKEAKRRAENEESAPPSVWYSAKSPSARYWTACGNY